MPERDYYVPGANNIFCQVCMKKIKSFEAKRRYDNVLCCSYCWNKRHESEYPPRIRPELPPVVIAPEPPEVPSPFCELYNRQMIGGMWYPGCAFPGSYFGYNVGPVLVQDPNTFEPTEFIPEIL